MEEETLTPEEFSAGPAAGPDPDTLTPEQFTAGAGGQPSDPDTMTPDEWEASPTTSSASGAATRGVAEGALPGLGGAAAGFWTGAALAPATGGWSIPIGVLAGLASGMGIDQVQDYLLEKLGIRGGQGPFSRTQQNTDEAQHPYARFAGQMAPGLATLSPGKGIQAGARALSGGIGGGITAAVDAYQTDEVDPTKVAMGIAGGAAFPNANALGRRFEQAGAGAAARFRGGNKSPEAPRGGEGFTLEGESYTPESRDVGFRRRGNENAAEPPETIFQGQEREGGVIPPQNDRGLAAPDPDMSFAQQQRDGFPQGGPMWTFWDEHLQNLQSRAGGKGDAQTIDASQGPHGDQNEFTYHQTNQANDVTTVAKGVAAENRPAPRIQEAGNPIGAPMLARDAARPLAPTRDYRKLKPPDQVPKGARESTPLSTAPIHEDIQASLRAHEGEVIPPDPRNRPTPEELGLHDTGLGDRQRAVGAKEENLPGFEDFVMSEEHTPRAPRPEDFHYTPKDEDAYHARQDAMREGQEPYTIEGTTSGETPRVNPQRPLPRPTPRKPVIHEDLTSPYRPQPEAPPPETRLASEDQYKVDATRRALEQHGMKRMVDNLDRLPPEQQVKAAEQIKAVLEAHGKAEYDKSNRPTLSTGVQGRSKADAARKGGALEAIERATAKFGGSGQSEHVPTSVADRQALVERLQAMWDHAVELNGGKNPIDRKEGYTPREKPAAWTALRAAKRVIDRPTPANIREYFSAEKALGEGKPGEGNVFQETERIEADIAKRPHITNQAALDAIQAKTHVEDTGPERYPELDRLLRPVRLKSEGDESLSTRPGQVELVPAEDVKGRAQRVKTPADVAKFEGRRIDPNSAEGKAIAAAALKANPKASVRETREQFAERLAGEKGLAKDRIAEPTPEEKEATAAVTEGSDKTAFEHWARMLANNTSGSLNPSAIGKDLSDWMKTSGKVITEFWHPRVPESIINYGKQIGMAGTMLNTQLTRIKQRVLANARVAVHPDGSVPKKDEFSGMRRAYEDRDMNSLPAKDKTYFDNYVQPLLDQANDAYRDLREISQRLSLPGADKMPEQMDNGPEHKKWFPRRLRADQEEENFNPLFTRSLSNWAASGQTRDWFALQNDQGARRIYRINDDGNIVFYQDGKAGSARSAPASFDPAQVGSELRTSDGRTWKVDNAGLDELVQHGRGDKGKKLDYVDNPVIAASDAVVGLRSALARVRLLENVLNDPLFQNMNTRSEAKAKELWGTDYAKTDLPQLKERYMPKAMAWAFDDMVKTGFRTDNLAAAKLGQWSQALLKPFYMLGPEVHVFNELDKFISGSPILGKQLPNLPKHLKDAVQSVWHQDGLQAEIMDAGGNPMYGHAATSRLMPQIGKMVGEDMSIRPFKYDPLMKLFNVNSKDVFDHLLQQSNKTMWWQSDVLYTAMYKAFRAKGLDPRAAVHETEKIIDSYVVPTTFGKTIGLGAEYGGIRGDAGRAIQKFLTDPMTANFGRFSYGLFKTGANTVKNLLEPNSSYAQRVAGAAQLAMMFVAMPLAYEGLSKLYQGITGNPNSEFEQRGITRVVNTPKAIAHGEKSPSAIAQRVWSPSVPVDTALRLWEGKDFAGRPIYDTPGHFGEFAAGQAVSPVRAISAGAEKGNAAQGFIESNLGLKTPSDAAVHYKATAPRRAVQDYRKTTRHPRGWIDRAINSTTGR